ncbi:MAG: DnaA N-terminal domain-containing protein, partial [Burkholderiaceae bacterium]
MSASPILSTPDELPALDQLWQDCLDHLEKSLPSQQFKTWVAPLALGGWRPSQSPIQIDILAPNRFKQTWAREQLVEPLTNWWQARLQQAVDLQILVTPEAQTEPGTNPEKSTTVASDEPGTLGASLDSNISSQPVGQETARLNPDWTFDLFV